MGRRTSDECKCARGIAVSHTGVKRTDTSRSKANLRYTRRSIIRQQREADISCVIANDVIAAKDRIADRWNGCRNRSYTNISSLVNDNASGRPGEQGKVSRTSVIA